ncbi:MAG: DUF427 domain-containing protein [Planktomarina sp.]
MTEITLSPLPGKWAVRVSGAVIAETDNAVAMSGDDKTVFIPQSDIAMAFLDVAKSDNDDPDRQYFDIESRTGPISQAAWTFTANGPKELQNHVAFQNSDFIAVESVNG